MKLLVVTLCATLSAVAAHAETALKPWQVKALKDVKAEKTVLDARWRDPVANVLNVSMVPNGTPRFGFAEYLCMGLMKADGPAEDLKTVWIYDPVTYEAGGKAMGVAACR